MTHDPAYLNLKFSLLLITSLFTLIGTSTAFNSIFSTIIMNAFWTKVQQRPWETFWFAVGIVLIIGLAFNLLIAACQWVWSAEEVHWWAAKKTCEAAFVFAVTFFATALFISIRNRFKKERGQGQDVNTQTSSVDPVSDMEVDGPEYYANIQGSDCCNSIR